MDYATEYEQQDFFAADAALDERTAFIRRTYAHVFGAVAALVAIEAFFLSTPAIVNTLVPLLFGHWWITLIAFMAVSWIAERWAHSDVSQGTQYMGLGLYVLAEAVILCPLLAIAMTFGSPDLIPMAAFLTLLIFAGLTAIVMLTKSDFSFLRNILWLGGLVAIGTIFASMIMGFSLGLVFVSAMIALMSGWILYDTSNIVHHYRTDQHVGAALALFASIATLFWYMVQLLMLLGGGGGGGGD